MKIKNSKDVIEGWADRMLLNEKCDCTVRSVATALQLPYIAAHFIASKFGRRSRQGMNGRDWYLMMSDFEVERIVKQLKPEEVQTYYPSTKKHRRMRLSTFIKSHSTGRYILDLRGHATSVVDGEVVEASKHISDQYVLTAWKVL